MEFLRAIGPVFNFLLLAGALFFLTRKRIRKLFRDRKERIAEALGRAADAHLKRRSDARPGDVIFTAGELGTSGAGLQDILAGRCDTPAAAVHRNPQPQVAEGIWLGSRPEVRAMMDLSDGLASDLKHILDRSGVGAEVAVEQIPAAPGADVRMAACSGEDYKLLLTAAPEVFSSSGLFIIFYVIPS